ncbi:hypothetical protein HMPREF3213_03627 [Heyndrickxia coagulans]|uniref:Uncharacterized protein n=1 Tax=Heyndrickxia coagulans TaxID=1398 RepID=A0A133KBI1_HEYCO|nr:hypothetical protein HMPREF3213_03627 [Heyndrickxia coagulans]
MAVKKTVLFDKGITILLALDESLLSRAYLLPCLPRPFKTEVSYNKYFGGANIMSVKVRFSKPAFFVQLKQAIMSALPSRKTGRNSRKAPA